MIPSKVCIQSHMVLVYCICLFWYLLAI
jgi:hypothetical protein